MNGEDNQESSGFTLPPAGEEEKLEAFMDGQEGAGIDPALLNALNEAHPEEAPQGFVISEQEMQAPADLVNAPEGAVPEGGGFGLEGTEQEPESLPGDLADFPDPNENPDPALAVDEMLSAAILPEGDEIAVLAADPAADAPPSPSFQLQFPFLEDSQRGRLKELAQAHGLNLHEAPGAHPLLSQLNEFQLLNFRQAASAAGIAAKTLVSFPMPALSEEDQALGDLAAVPEGPALKAEGAASVNLPRGEKDVLLLAESVAGIQLVESLGIVTAHRSIARRFFREEEAQEKLKKELKKIPGKNDFLPASRLEALFREIFLDLQKGALAKGGNAVLGLRLEAFPETSSLDPSLEQLRLVAFGTAAVVEKA